MDWNAVGAIGEIIGAAAVVATLAYLARETRANTKAVVAESVRATSWGFAEFNTQIAADPELAKMVSKSQQTPMCDYDELEWLRFQIFARSEVNRIQDSYIQSRLGFSDKDFAEGMLNHLRGLLEYPAWRVFWDDETRGDNFLSEFVADINSRAVTHIGMSKLPDL